MTHAQAAPITINGRVVAALIALYDVHQKTVAAWLGVDPSQVTRRMHGDTQWSAKDIGALASHMGVPTDTFYLSTEEAIARLGSRGGDGGHTVTLREHIGQLAFDLLGTTSTNAEWLIAA